VQLVPAIVRRISDLDRIRSHSTDAPSLASIDRDLLHQALTPPAAMYGSDYQRLETLGDAVIKICTIVNLFQTYPFKHEGILTAYKDACVSNKYLRRRALQRDWEARSVLIPCW
jgi:endoribonuclease Dicer